MAEQKITAPPTSVTDFSWKGTLKEITKHKIDK